MIYALVVPDSKIHQGIVLNTIIIHHKRNIFNKYSALKMLF